MTSDAIRDRIASICAGVPFAFTEAATPFSFELQPSGQVDEVFRVEVEGSTVLGGLNFTEERTDLVHIWLARKYAGEPTVRYTQLVSDASSLRAAVIRDGAVSSGEYSVPDPGAGAVIQREVGKEFAVLQLTVPVNYELSF